MIAPIVKKALIIYATSREFGLTSPDILNRSRKPRVDDARQAAMYIGHHFGHTVGALADFFRRTKWTIRHDIQSCKDKMDTEPDFYRHVFAVVERLMQQTCMAPEMPLHRHD